MFVCAKQESHPSRSNNPTHFTQQKACCPLLYVSCKGHVVLGGASPGRPTKLRNRTFSALEQKSSERRKSKLRVELFTVSTKGTRYKSFQKAHVPPAKTPFISQPSTLHLVCKLICLLCARLCGCQLTRLIPLLFAAIYVFSARCPHGHLNSSPFTSLLKTIISKARFHLSCSREQC